MKQTAVEWFLNEFKKQVWFEENSELDIWINDLIPKAKAMEKEQIIDAYLKDIGKVTIDKALVHWDKAEEYYNETYESNN